jgi:hypothetical protein
LISRSGRDHGGHALAVTRSTSAGAKSRHPVRGGSFVAAVSRTRRSGPVIPGLRSLAGRLGFFPRCRPAALMGLSPFAGLLPIGGWTRGSRIRFSVDSRAPLAAPACGARPSGTRQPPESLRIPLLNGRRAFRSRAFRCGRRSLTRASDRDVPLQRASLLVRAHVPVDRSRPRPDIFRRGDRVACGETRDRSERRPIRTFVESIRLLGFVPAVGPCRRFPVRSAPGRSRRPFLPWALPLSGLSATPGVRPVVRARLRVRPRIASPASGPRLSRAPIRSWALGRFLPG